MPGTFLFSSFHLPRKDMSKIILVPFTLNLRRPFIYFYVILLLSTVFFSFKVDSQTLYQQKIQDTIRNKTQDKPQNNPQDKPQNNTPIKYSDKTQEKIPDTSQLNSKLPSLETKTEQFTLQTAINYAIDNNLTLKEIKLSRSLDDDILLQSRLNILPNLNGTLDRYNTYGRTINPSTNTYFNNSTSYDQGILNSSVVLFGGFQKINIIKQNKYQILSDQSNYEKNKNDLIINVVTNYIAILSYKDLIVSSEDKLKVSQQTLDFDKKKMEAGTITESDYLNDKTTYDQDDATLTTYQNSLDIAKTTLAGYMNLDPSKPLDIFRPDSIDVSRLKSDYNEMDVYQKAIENLPDLKTAEYTALVEKKALAIAKGGLYPNLVLAGSYGTSYSPSITQTNFTGTYTSQYTNSFIKAGGQSDSLFTLFPNSATSAIPFLKQLKNNIQKSISLTLTIPIFNGWQQHLAVKKAEYQYNKALLDKEITKANLYKTIVQAIIDLKAAEKTYYASKSAAESSKKAFFYSQIRYKVGLLNSLDFNLSGSKYAIAEATAIQNRYNYLFKAKIIDFYLGNPINL